MSMVDLAAVLSQGTTARPWHSFARNDGVCGESEAPHSLVVAAAQRSLAGVHDAAAQCVVLASATARPVYPTTVNPTRVCRGPSRPPRQ